MKEKKELLKFDIIKILFYIYFIFFLNKNFQY